MGRLFCGLLVFLGAMLMLHHDPRAVEVAARRSREHFGIEIRPGTRHHRFMTIFIRTLNVVGGGALVAFGFLGMFGVLPLPWP